MNIEKFSQHYLNKKITIEELKFIIGFLKDNDLSIFDMGTLENKKFYHFLGSVFSLVIKDPSEENKELAKKIWNINDIQFQDFIKLMYAENTSFGRELIASSEKDSLAIFKAIWKNGNMTELKQVFKNYPELLKKVPEYFKNKEDSYQKRLIEDRKDERYRSSFVIASHINLPISKILACESVGVIFDPSIMYNIMNEDNIREQTRKVFSYLKKRENEYSIEEWNTLILMFLKDAGKNRTHSKYETFIDSAFIIKELKNKSIIKVNNIDLFSSIVTMDLYVNALRDRNYSEKEFIYEDVFRVYQEGSKEDVKQQFSNLLLEFNVEDFFKKDYCKYEKVLSEEAKLELIKRSWDSFLSKESSLESSKDEYGHSLDNGEISKISNMSLLHIKRRKNNFYKKEFVSYFKDDGIQRWVLEKSLLSGNGELFKDTYQVCQEAWLACRNTSYQVVAVEQDAVIAILPILTSLATRYPEYEQTILSSLNKKAKDNYSDFKRVSDLENSLQIKNEPTKKMKI